MFASNCFVFENSVLFYQGEDQRYNGVVQSLEMSNNSHLRFRIAVGNGFVLRGDTCFRLVGEASCCRFITWTLGVQGASPNAGYAIPRTVLPVCDGESFHKLYDGATSAYRGAIPVSYPLYSMTGVPSEILQHEEDVEPVLCCVLADARDIALEGGLVEDLS